MKKGFLAKAIALMACLLCSIGAMAQEAYANYTPADSTLTFYYDSQRSSRPGTTYSMNTGDSDPDWITNYYTDRVIVYHLVFDPSFDAARLNTSVVTDMGYMFHSCRTLRSVDLSGFNTANVTNMTSMFAGCTYFTSLDLSGLNTGKVTDMSFMFNGCTNLSSLNLSGLNTSNVTTMLGMFNGCTSLTALDLSSLNTANVTTMQGMFYDCASLTSLDLSGLNASSVTTMEEMFLIGYPEPERHKHVQCDKHEFCV